jgi:hypothetical protein
MTVTIIIILAMILILCFISFMYRNATLDRLKPLPGEKTIFEEGGIKVEQYGTPRSMIYGKCRIRITEGLFLTYKPKRGNYGTL